MYAVSLDTTKIFDSLHMHPVTLDKIFSFPFWRFTVLAARNRIIAQYTVDSEMMARRDGYGFPKGQQLLNIHSYRKLPNFNGYLSSPDHSYPY